VKKKNKKKKKKKKKKKFDCCVHKRALWKTTGVTQTQSKSI
jgi:hypothetical protein